MIREIDLDKRFKKKCWGNQVLPCLLYTSIDDGKNKFIDCKEQNIYLDEDIREFFFDDGIKKSFWKNLKESILLEPNFNGIGIDLKKLFQK